MSGVYIRHEVILGEPEVERTTEALRLPRLHVVGCYVAIWSWADRHMRDLNGGVTGLSVEWFDQLVGVQGFMAAAAQQAPTWVRILDGRVILPHIERHNGTGAKERIDARRRQREKRKREQRERADATPPKRLVSVADNGAGVPAEQADLLPNTIATEFAEAFNTYCADKCGLPRVTLPLSKARKQRVTLRLREHPPEWWAEVFGKVAGSKFLQGQNGQGWRASFDWFIANPENAVKVSEGSYR